MKDRIQALLDLNIGFRFCPPSSKDYPNGRIYLKKAILENPDQDAALRNLNDCELRAQIILADDVVIESERQARKDEIIEIKTYANQIDGSSKPEWEKKLLKRLIKELKD